MKDLFKIIGSIIGSIIGCILILAVLNLIKTTIFYDIHWTAYYAYYHGVVAARRNGGSVPFLLMLVGSPFCMIFIITAIFFGTLPLYLFLRYKNSGNLKNKQYSTEKLSEWIKNRKYKILFSILFLFTFIKDYFLYKDLNYSMILYYDSSTTFSVLNAIVDFIIAVSVYILSFEIQNWYQEEKKTQNKTVA